MKKYISKGKYDRMLKLTNDNGVIDALAIDQRGSLVKATQKAAEEAGKTWSMDMVYDFKEIVSKYLSPLSSAILLDEQMGFKGIQTKSADTGLIMSYEKTGYDADTPGRQPALIPEQSAQIMIEKGADALKVLVYYNPNDPDEVNDAKRAFAERYGTEAMAAEVPTFFEVVTYDDRFAPDSLEFAKIKPELVIKSIKEFTQDKYHIDVLKMEVPFNPKYVKEWNSDLTEAAYAETEAQEYLKTMGEAATRPFIFLSAGVPMATFQRELKLAGKANVPFSGVLSGRATWIDGIEIFVKEGSDALIEWLKDQGTKNITGLTSILNETAIPWYEVYGGKDNLEIVESEGLK
ncbi:tagatose 1,6-diphosphate aldolase [Lentilactobacillus sp. SPB1-3]|uniref:Tagatose 1,6-diphosphate aldolase n=1 Tax=Lentilactobacillus terminaliae TaxID=3003483 RepID=A0ACD5DFQ3_9LACO|nr:tagatose 1,6-diphosphate aldolase [Lentilactobacillus sp. SPB1-3]MCZ0976733.1 tagatose 1,6-diphosphate aldolase [Lentilactobacillus sp. SPB1-3]